MIAAMLRSALGLAAFAMVTVGLIALTRLVTADRIEANEQALRMQALARVVPPALHDQPLIAGTLVSAGAALGHREPVTLYRALQDGRVTAVAVPVRAPDGYGGPIDLIVGIRADGTIIAADVVSHRETPGLGDAIERRKSDWITRFEGRSLADPQPARWAVRRDGGEFDALTGATITPRAVVRAIRRGLETFAAEREDWLAPPRTTAASPTAEDRSP